MAITGLMCLIAQESAITMPSSATIRTQKRPEPKIARMRAGLAAV